MQITNLRVESLRAPMGIECPNPSFGWQATDAPDGWRQAAYRIAVTPDGTSTPLWDSGRVASSRMCGIAYAGAPLAADSAYQWRVTVWGNDGDDPVHAASSFATGLLHAVNWHGQWIGEAEDFVGHIWRHAFTVDRPIARASLYVCGLGHYEGWLNGARVGDRVLEPGWTNYDKSCLYSAYDVTAQLQQGENAIGFYLGDGMFNVPGGRYVYFERCFGKMKLLVQLNIAYADGTAAEVVTGPHWRMAPSPNTFNCIYGGLDYDARLEQDGFATSAFAENEGWQAARAVPPPEGGLVCQTMPPVKVMQSYAPVSVEETAPGVYLYDFGTNLSGWASIRLSAVENPKGRIVTLTPGEILDSARRPDQRVTGRGYHWQWTLNAKRAQAYAPKFTYTGFRYVQVEGATPRALVTATETGPILEAITGEFVYPDVEATGAFTCDNPLFNDIHRIVRQAMLSNMKSVLTDCPHREKLGWMEQTHLIGPGLLYNFDLLPHYQKIMRDIAEAQHDNGMVPSICPQYVVFGYHAGYNDSPEWGSAAVINPWYLYRRYGDEAILARSYDVMRRYVDYLTSRAHHHVLHHGLGDWLDINLLFTVNAQNPPNTPVPVVATCVYYFDVTILARTAALLGHSEDAARYAALAREIRREFRLQFLDKQNIRVIRVANGSQAAQAMALVTGLIDEDETELTLAGLVRDIEARGWTTSAGDVGHPFVVAALTLLGRSDVLDRMTNITDKPGYGYQVKCGATTLTEDWDGPNPDHPHGSQNHFMLGGIEEWFYTGLAGLGSLRTDLPFDRVLVKPCFVASCNEVDAWTMHPYGRVAIHWHRAADGIHIDLTVPPGLQAQFISTIDGAERLLQGGRHRFVLPIKEEA